MILLPALVKKDNPSQPEGLDRRAFLRVAAGGCAALTSLSYMSAVLNLQLTKAAIAASPVTGYKALVCMFLHGGIDSYNLMTPYEDGEYDDYANVRGPAGTPGGLALPKFPLGEPGTLLPITDANSGRQFGLHPRRAVYWTACLLLSSGLILSKFRAMLKGPHPKHVNDISAEWLTLALREGGALSDAGVIGVETKVIGEGVGFLSSVGRIQMRYDRKEPDAPASVVVKIQPEMESFRQIGDEFHAFEREIRFYRDVASQVPIRLPRVYSTVMEPPDYAIVMEDLSFCAPGDQLVGMHTDQVIATTRVMAHIQARFWNNEAIESLAWMPAPTPLAIVFGSTGHPLLTMHRGALARRP